MKPDGVQRSVRSSRSDRAPGSAPDVGRVARIPGTGLPKGERRKRRRSEGGRGSRLREGKRMIVIIWSVLGCVAVLAALGGVIWIWVHNKMKAGVEAVAVAPVELQEKPLAISKFPSPSEENAERLVRSALAIRDVGKVSNFFRPGASTPEQIVDFLKRLEAMDGAIGHFEWLSSVDANGMSLDGVIVGFKGTAQKPKNRLAFLTPDDEGVWKIDFDAFARTNTPPWTEFLESKRESALVRIYVAKDTYYNGPFRDENEWISFGIASPDLDQILVGYCKRGTPQAAALDSLLSNDKAMVRATLEIRRVEGADGRQFQISRVFAEDWVIGPSAFDERFK